MSIVSALPLTPYLGPLFRKQESMNRLHRISLMKKVNKMYAKLLKTMGLVTFYPFSHEHADLQPYLWEGFDVHVRYTYVIDLKNSLDNIWKSMDKRRRWEIKRALKSGIVVEESTKITEFIRLFNESMKRHKIERRYEDIWMKLFHECSPRNMCKIFTAYAKNGESIASIFIVWDNKRTYYIGSGMSVSMQGASSLLIWRAIEFSKKMSLLEFDFEGSSIPSIEEYFRKFGGELRMVQYIRSNSLLLILARKLRSLFV